MYPKQRSDHRLLLKFDRDFYILFYFLHNISSHLISSHRIHLFLLKLSYQAHKHTPHRTYELISWERNTFHSRQYKSKREQKRQNKITLSEYVAVVLSACTWNQRMNYTGNLVNLCFATLNIYQIYHNLKHKWLWIRHLILK